MCNIKQILLFLFYNQVSKSLNHLLSLLKKKIAKAEGKKCHISSFQLVLIY